VRFHNTNKTEKTEWRQERGVYLYPLLFFGEREDQKSKSSCLFVDKGFFLILFLKT
jgi:hypothetical protein